MGLTCFFLLPLLITAAAAVTSTEDEEEATDIDDLSPLDLNCTFEDGLCSWTEDKYSDAPWHSTTPVFDIPAPPQGERFLRLNYNRKKKWGDRGQVFSPVIDRLIPSIGVDFWFYVRSPGLYTYTALKFGLVNERLVFHWLFGSPSITNGWQPKWIHVSLCIPKLQTDMRLVFFAEAERGHEVALDDVVVTEHQVKSCGEVTLLSPKVLSSECVQCDECVSSSSSSSVPSLPSFFFSFFLIAMLFASVRRP